MGLHSLRQKEVTGVLQRADSALAAVRTASFEVGESSSVRMPHSEEEAYLLGQIEFVGRYYVC